MMRLHSRTNERSDGNQFDVGGRGGACRPPPFTRKGDAEEAIKQHSLRWQ